MPRASTLPSFERLAKLGVRNSRGASIAGFALGSVRAGAVLLVLAALMLAPAAAVAGPSADDLQAEIEKQRQLLDRLQSEAEDDDSGRAGANLDPRSAPRAPKLREFPVAIFDEKPVVIPAREWGNAEALRVLQRFLDADGDGKPELLRFVDRESDFLLRQEEDRDYDGRLDAFSDFEWGKLKRRRVDDDGNGEIDGWEEYAEERMTKRAVDRDGDGVRDAFYEYDEGMLVVEKHDANNDGKTDREITYKNRVRIGAVEDTNYDGQTDVWHTYAVRDGSEIITRIERDKQGRGKPDVFEVFVAQGGKAVLARREEDHDGDGKADLVSVFREGRLVRRELSKPDLRPL